MSERLAVGRHGGHVTVRLDGDLDIADVEQVRLSILDAVGDEAQGLVVDLSTTRYIDSAGIHMLFDLVRRLQERRQTMAIALPDDSSIATLLKITNVDQAMPVCRTIAECVDALRDEVGLY